MKSKMFVAVQNFVNDYCERHKHPANAILHIFGVPTALLGLYWLCSGSAAGGFVLLTVGYLLQYVGHKVQGNEVGEVTLLKSLFRRVMKQRGS